MIQYELQIMARLNHPNIVRVYGGCMTPPNLFVVEELLAGDLSAHIHRRGPGSPPLDLSMSLGIAINISAGLVSLFPAAKPGKLGGCACMERGNKLRLHTNTGFTLNQPLLVS